MGIVTFTREDLIRAAITHAKSHLGPISLQDFCRAQGVSSGPIYRHFKSFSTLLEEAGVGNRLRRLRRADFQTLMHEFHRVAQLTGRLPTRTEIAEHGRILPKTYVTNLGPWPKVVSTYETWLASSFPSPAPPGGGGVAAAATEGAPPSPSSTQPSGTGVPPVSTSPTCPTSPLEGDAAPPAAGDGSPAPHPKSDIPHPTFLLGSPLGFRHLLHAPTNELGVIHLFGLLSPDLAIAVEHIGAAYPDCRALRPEPGTSGKWRRIAIEFELRSSNFKYHGHDPKLRDLVVCWEHDWQACPVEVLELKSVMKRVGK